MKINPLTSRLRGRAYSEGGPRLPSRVLMGALLRAPVGPRVCGSDASAWDGGGQTPCYWLSFWRGRVELRTTRLNLGRDRFDLLTSGRKEAASQTPQLQRLMTR